MKLDDLSNKNETNLTSILDNKKNNIFLNLNPNQISKKSNNLITNNNQKNIDPRLELTLKYLDIYYTLDIFINNNISFNDILLLSKKDLIELGFTLVERNRIFNFSQEYKNYGVNYNISEINNFFKEFQNLNIRLNTNNNNNYNKYDIQKKENINGNINLNAINKTNSNNNGYHKSLLLSTKPIIKNNEKNKEIAIKNNSTKKRINISSKNTNKKNTNLNYLSQETNFQDSINTYQNNNINNNQNTSKLIRQNSRVSKNSNYSKSNKSKLVNTSKIYGGGVGSSSGSIVQKYQNLSEEIDNYFKKYNENKETKKNRMKKYEIISSSYKRKKNNSFYNNDNNDINTNNNNYGENDVNDEKKEEEINLKLKELQRRKKELKDKLNTICEKENKKLMIIQYLEEED